MYTASVVFHAKTFWTNFNSFPTLNIQLWYLHLTCKLYIRFWGITENLLLFHVHRRTLTNFHSSAQECLSDVQCEIVQSECVKSGRPYQGDFYHNRVPLFKMKIPAPITLREIGMLKLGSQFLNFFVHAQKLVFGQKFKSFENVIQTRCAEKWTFQNFFWERTLLGPKFETLFKHRHKTKTRVLTGKGFSYNFSYY